MQTTVSGAHVKSIIVPIVLAAVSVGASAEQGGATFTVAVTVPVRITLDVADAPTALELTSQDVARGYKDVAVRYHVRHNDRRGYLLELSTLDGVAQLIEVRGLDADVVVHDTVAIPRPGTPFDQDLALDLRVVLDPAAAIGTFAWPLRVAATPI